MIGSYHPLIDDRVLKVAGAARKMKRTYVKTGYQDSLIRKLKELGYNLLGRGAYSVVFNHTDPDKVIKITMSEVDGYHKYIEWIQAHTPVLSRSVVKHLPKIHATVVYKGARITVMEKLKPIRYNTGGTVSYKETVATLQETAYMLGLVDDSNDRNIMRRGKTYVITDPWSHTE